MSGFRNDNDEGLGQEMCAAPADESTAAMPDEYYVQVPHSFHEHNASTMGSMQTSAECNYFCAMIYFACTRRSKTS